MDRYTWTSRTAISQHKLILLSFSCDTQRAPHSHIHLRPQSQRTCLGLGLGLCRSTSLNHRHSHTHTQRSGTVTLTLQELNATGLSVVGIGTVSVATFCSIQTLGFAAIPTEHLVSIRKCVCLCGCAAQKDYATCDTPASTTTTTATTSTDQQEIEFRGCCRKI